MEYALHFTSSAKGNDVDNRGFDSSKIKFLDHMDSLIKSAEGFYQTPDGVNYYIRNPINRKFSILVSKENSIKSQVLYRVAGLMPGRKMGYIKKKQQPSNKVVV